MRVLVTGGNGFIGQWVVEELEARGHEPLVFDRHHSTDVREVFLGDIRDETAVSEAMAHADGWIHLAGVLGTQETILNPRPAVETNVIGGVNVLQAASEYELPGVYIAVGNWWMNNSYSISKTAVERLCWMYQRERGLHVSVVRTFNAYGPGQVPAAPFGSSKVRKIMPAFICRALTGQPIEVYGDGQQVMDMVYVADVADVLVNTLERTIEQPFTVTVEAGTGMPTTVLDIAQRVADHASHYANGYSPITFLPMRPGEPEHAVVKAAEQLPGYIQLEDGVARTVDWYAQEWLPTWNG